MNILYIMRLIEDLITMKSAKHLYGKCLIMVPFVATGSRGRTLKTLSIKNHEMQYSKQVVMSQRVKLHL
jgi:hypothetical protein